MPLRCCNDPAAFNFRSAATVDDGSCWYAVPGCMDATNFVDVNLDEFNGWRPLIQDIEVVELPGGHSTMCHEPHVRVFARRLDAVLDRIQQARGASER